MQQTFYKLWLSLDPNDYVIVLAETPDEAIQLAERTQCTPVVYFRAMAESRNALSIGELYLPMPERRSHQ